MKNILKIKYILVILIFYSSSYITIKSAKTIKETIITYKETLRSTIGDNIVQNILE